MHCVVTYPAHGELESKFINTTTTNNHHHHHCCHCHHHHHIIIIIIIVIIISDSLHWCLQSYCLDGTEETEDEQLFETWLLLEYCDKGSLQDAVDRGWFHADQNGHIDSRTKPNMGAIRSAVAVSC